MTECKITLRYWPGDYGVPSVEPDGLQALIYSKINKCKIALEEGKLPQWKAIPSIYTKEQIYSRPDEFIAVLKNLALNGEDSDNRYYPDDLSNIEVYKKYITEELKIYILLAFWKSFNYEKVTYPYYASVIPFPFNSFYIRSKRAQIEENLLLLSGKLTIHNFMDHKLERISQCLMDLSTRLGENKYFMGAHPSSLDAVVYGYLAPIYYAPFTNDFLQNKIRGHQNLVTFINRMTRTYFPDLQVTNKYVKPVVDDLDSTPIWQMVVAGCVAGAAMFAFAYFHGIYTFKR